MVVDATERKTADQLFHALGDSTRRDIVQRCLHGEYSVSELARNYPMSFAAVQKHVAVLASAGLVTKRRRGREQIVKGNIHSIQQVHELLDQLEVQWRHRINQIGEILADNSNGGVKT